MLSGRFTVKVFEKSGDFSVDQQVATISPYDTYFGIGVATQKSDWGDEYLDSRKEHIIKVVMLDSKGKPEPGSENVLVSVYKMDSYWWWDASRPIPRRTTPKMRSIRITRPSRQPFRTARDRPRCAGARAITAIT